ncbi:MAG TPA: hypothetical protein VJY54_11335 [Lachnospiraceae bacterium]|nr:hypothetical protein [Lachnospiraceae bacterium]
MIEEQYKPIPAKYEDFSASKAREETNQYFEKIHMQYTKMGPKGAEYRSKINQLIRSRADVNMLSELMLSEDYQQFCCSDGDLNTFVAIGQIALKEDSVGIPTIIQDVNSLEEAISLFQQISFGLRRVAFGWKRNETSDFFELIKQHNISYICLAESICQSTIVNQITTASMLAKLMFEQNMAMEALKMLIMLDSMFAYSEEKILEFTNAFLNIGSKKMAYEEILKYRNPNEEISLLIRQLAD